MSSSGGRRALDLQLKRAYDAPDEGDGHRVLVDRLWPRGLSRDRAKVDDWKRELAPSDELRKWFAHKAERFEDFKRRYRAELQSHREALRQLRSQARDHRVTLIYAAKDPDHNNAVVLADVLRRGLPRS